MLTEARSLALAVLFTGCPDDGDGEPTYPPGETACGKGPLSIDLGDDSPFVANPDDHYTILMGLQGGYHFEPSIRVQGAINPDHTDVELTLRQGEGVVRARHLTADWLLRVDRSGPWCDYPRARLVLIDEAGGLIERDRLEEIAAGPLTLEVKLGSPDGGGTVTLPITLDVPSNL